MERFVRLLYQLLAAIDLLASASHADTRRNLNLLPVAG